MSTRIPQSFIDDVLARTDLVELIDQRVPLKKNGQNYAACCPFHQEKTPSFTVSPTKQFYHCFGCGVHGTAISFLMEYDRYNFIEALEQLAHKAGLTLPKTEFDKAENKKNTKIQSITNDVCQVYHDILQQQGNAKPARDYLKQRGISPEVQNRFALGFAPPGWNTLERYFDKQQNVLLSAGLLVKKDNKSIYDRFRNRVLFPIKNRRGSVIGFGGRVLDDSLPKYLNSPETSIFQKNRELYGLYEANRDIQAQQYAIIVEGYMDVLSLHQHGILNSVATLGTASNSLHFEKLFKVTSDIICCFDGDTAGDKAAWRALESTLPSLRDGRQVKFLFLPEGEDPDSYIKSYGKEKFLKLIAGATSLTEFFVTHLSENIQDLDDVAGKVRLANQASQLLQNMPNGLQKELLLKELAKEIDMDIERLSELSDNVQEQKTQANNTSPQTKTHGTKPSTMRLAIILLLQNPSLIGQISPGFDVSGLDNPGTEILMKLVELLRESPNMTSGGLVENWRDHPQEPLLKKLLLWDNIVPEQGITAEFQAAIARLEEDNKQQLINNLIDKANHFGLKHEERITLHKLLSQQKKSA